MASAQDDPVRSNGCDPFEATPQPSLKRGRRRSKASLTRVAKEGARIADAAKRALPYRESGMTNTLFAWP
jgi:hypothetical protein